MDFSSVVIERELPKLDEKLYLDVFAQAQHPTIEHEWTASDPHTLLNVRVLVAAIARTRCAVVGYRAAVRRSLREPYRDGDDLPF